VRGPFRAVAHSQTTIPLRKDSIRAKPTSVAFVPSRAEIEGFLPLKAQSTNSGPPLEECLGESLIEIPDTLDAGALVDEELKPSRCKGHTDFDANLDSHYLGVRIGPPKEELAMETPSKVATSFTT